MIPTPASRYRVQGRTTLVRLEGLSFNKKPNSWFNSIQNGSGQQTENQQGGDQQNNGPVKVHRHVLYGLPASLAFSHEYRPVSPQHIDGRNNDAPQCDRANDLKCIEP